MVPAETDDDDLPRLDLSRVLRDPDVAVARAIALDALDDPELAELVADLIAPFAGALSEIAASTMARVEEAIELSGGDPGPDDVARLLDLIFERIHEEFSTMFSPNFPMQRVLNGVAEMFAPLRNQLIQAASTLDTDFEPAMPATFASVIVATVDALESERPKNWPKPLWLHTALLVVAHGTPVVGVVPPSVVERCIQAASDGGDPFDEVVQSAPEVLTSVATLANDPTLQEAEPALAAELNELIAVIGGRSYGSAIRTAFAIIDALLYRREFRSYGDYVQALVPSLDEVPVTGMRDALVRHCLAPCYVTHDVSQPDPPVALNRHAVMHGVDRQHATFRDALFACLLAATLLESETTSMWAH